MGLIRSAIFLLSTFSSFAYAANCTPADIGRLRDLRLDYDQRGDLAACLVNNYFQNFEVTSELVHYLRNSNEHVFVREDIVDALANARWRKKVEVHESPGPRSMSKEEGDAVANTVASVQGLLAVTQLVKIMQEVLPTTKHEAEIVRALSEIVLNHGEHIELRIRAVSALEAIIKVEMDSGIYEEKSLRIAYEALKATANGDGDSANYYSGAKGALANLFTDKQSTVLANLERPSGGRALSTISH